MYPSELGALKAVRYERKGLKPDQLTPDQIEVNAYEPAKGVLAAWVKRLSG